MRPFFFITVPLLPLPSHVATILVLCFVAISLVGNLALANTEAWAGLDTWWWTKQSPIPSYNYVPSSSVVTTTDYSFHQNIKCPFDYLFIEFPEAVSPSTPITNDDWEWIINMVKPFSYER